MDMYDSGRTLVPPNLGQGNFSGPLYRSEFETLESTLLPAECPPLTDLQFPLQNIVEVTYSTYALNSLRSKKLRLKKPLLILLKETPEGFIAELSDINMWGHGTIEDEAVENLCLDFEDLYFCLKKEQANLGKEMQRQWEFLLERVEERN